MKTLLKIITCILTVSFLVSLAKAQEMEDGPVKKVYQPISALIKYEREQREIQLIKQMVDIETQLNHQTLVLQQEQQALSHAMEARMAQMERRVRNYFILSCSMCIALLAALISILRSRKWHLLNSPSSRGAIPARGWRDEAISSINTETIDRLPRRPLSSSQ